MKQLLPSLPALTFALLLSGGAVTGAHAQAPASTLSDYAFQADKGPRSKVVHYLKSNLDGTKRLVLSVHFDNPLKLEVLKVEADGQYLALVSAELDRETLTESRMRSYNGIERGKPRLQMAMEAERDANGARRLVASVAKAQLPVTLSQVPAHVYNFDLTGFNATLPHLKDPKRDFAVGIVDPDFEFLKTRFKPDGGVQQGGMVDRGRATFRYLGEEVLDEVPCFKYEVAGPAFKEVRGLLWINAKDRLIERFEHQLPDNPDWKTFKLSRISSRTMDLAGWEKFKAATVLRAMELRDEE